MKLYTSLAPYYDLIYDHLNYKEASSKLKQLIAKHKKSDGNELLDVACGTGNHLKYLSRDFRCSGLDLNKEMLAVARKKVKGVKFVQGNMLDFKMKKQFDVIACMFSSIGYMRTYRNLEICIKNFADHLKPGGLILIEPWLTKEEYNVGMPFMQTVDLKDFKLSRQAVSRKRGNLSIIDFHYLIAVKDKNVIYVKDHHEMGMFDIGKTQKIFEKAGLRAKHRIDGSIFKDRGMWIGVKPV